MPRRSIIRLSVLVFGVSALVCLPFLVFGEAVFVPLIESLRQNTGWLVAATIALLGLDALLPVPSAWVLIFLAAHAGTALGIVGGSLGLGLGVLVAIGVGRTAVGRMAPRFIPEAELTRLRDSMERHATLTLACLRSVPVLAETSVMIAAAAGVPTRRILLATFPANVAVATVYAFAANDSLLTACIAFAATIGVSYACWRAFEAIDTVRARARAS